MAKIITREFILKHPTDSGREDEVVSGDIRYTDAGKLKPVVVIIHGFKTFKDWGMFPYAGEYFAARGFISIVMNFSGNGVKPGAKKITEWDIFARNTPSKQIGDVHLILDALREGEFGVYGIHNVGGSLSLLGHSEGAAISLITASEREDIGAVIAWSSISTFYRLPAEIMSLWRKNGSLDFPDDPEYGTVRIGIEALNDLEQNRTRLDIVAAVKKLRCPLFFVQGTNDPTVSVEEAEQLFEISVNPKSGILKITDANHLYGVSHPYEKGSSKDFEYIIEQSYLWLNSKPQVPV
jgi:uncharacterized protein